MGDEKPADAQNEDKPTETPTDGKPPEDQSSSEEEDVSTDDETEDDDDDDDVVVPREESSLGFMPARPGLIGNVVRSSPSRKPPPN